MTANVMKGDRERCLEAGMDGYAAKPIEREQLYAALAEFAPHDRLASNAANAPPTPVDELFSFEAALVRISGGMEAVKQMSPMLISERAKNLELIRAGLAEQDAGTVRRGARAIKGSGDVFGATRVVQVAQALETIGKDGDLADGSEALAMLEIELGRLSEAIKAAT